MLNRFHFFSLKYSIQSIALIAIFIFVLSFLLRTSGLSHDLHLGWIYHPDTPKQIRATEFFLDDSLGTQYYFHRNNPDYDGYPYFNSHIIEYFFRGYFHVKTFVHWHLGVDSPELKASTASIYWATRLFNSLLSSLAVVLVFLIGCRHFSLSTGVIASFLLAFSPVDITTSNFAMSDSTSAFFALLAVFFALRIVESPKYYYYTAGALAASFAFSAKYHGGMALFPLGIAHLCTFPKPRTWTSVRFIILGLLLVLVFVAGVFFSTPSLLVYPSGAFKDIFAFFQHTSSFGMDEEMRALPLWSRFILAIRLNLPLLADYVGVVPLAATFAGMIWFRRSKYFWIIMSLPIFFMLVAVTMKPLTHPDYFTIAIPLIFLASAAFLGALIDKGIFTRAFTFLLVLYSLFYVGNYAWNEIFFFRHNDTRRIAETWAQDNIPKNFTIQARRYTFNSSPWHKTQYPVASVLALSAERCLPVDKLSLINKISLEQDKLSRIRNFNICFYNDDNRYMSSNFSLPVIEKSPATRYDNIIFSNSPYVVRTPKVVKLKHEEHFKATIVSDSPVNDYAFILHNAGLPADVTVEFAGERHSLVLAPNQRTAVIGKSPRQIFLSRNKNYFYPLKLSTEFNLEHIKIVLATTKLNIARELYLIGEYEAAYSYFLQSGVDSLNVSERLAMATSGLATGAVNEDGLRSILGYDLHRLVFDSPNARFDEGAASPDLHALSMDDDWFFSEFGIHPLVFEWLSPESPDEGPLDFVRRQTGMLRALAARAPDFSHFFTTDAGLLLQRGKTLESFGRHEEAFKFFKGTLRLYAELPGLYEAIDRIAPLLSTKSSEAKRIIHDNRTKRNFLAFPTSIVFANDLGISGVRINAVQLTTGQEFNADLIWDIPKLLPQYHKLMFRVKLTHDKTKLVVFDSHYHFVQSVMVHGSGRGDGFEPQIVVPMTEDMLSGTYTLTVALVIPEQRRVLRIKSPRNFGDGKYAPVAQFTLK